MDKDLSFYYENKNNLTKVDIENFIRKIINIEIQRLNIKTKIEIIFLYNSNIDYAGALTPNYERDSSNRYILPLKTNSYTLKINKLLIDEFYEQSKGKSNNIDGIIIPQSLNFLSMVTSLCSHEVRHAYQNETVKNDNIDDIESILWLKQDIVRNYFEDIYDLNYDNYFTEQDSNSYQHFLSFELLGKYSGLSSEELNKYKQYLKEKSIVPCKDKNLKEFFLQIDDKVTKRIGTAYIIELFNNIIKKLPKEFILNSMLKFEYNADGTKKNYVELENDKQKYLLQGLDYTKLYDFIVSCDYNLQVQKLSLELQKEDSKDTLIDLKRAYHTQEFVYEDLHRSLQKTINQVRTQIKKLSVEQLKGKISSIDASKEHIRLLNLSSMCRQIEQTLLNKICDCKEQKEAYERKEKYLKIIEEYKTIKNIYPILKNGTLVDTTNYNKLISDIIKQINDPNIKTDYKNYLLRVKEAIQIIYFPNTVEQNIKYK